MLFEVMICGLPCIFLRRVSFWLISSQNCNFQSLVMIVADVLLFPQELVVLALVDVGELGADLKG